MSRRQPDRAVARRRSLRLPRRVSCALLVLLYVANRAASGQRRGRRPFHGGDRARLGAILNAARRARGRRGDRDPLARLRASQIENGCNGLETLLLFASAVLAFPAPWKRRLAGLAARFRRDRAREPRPRRDALLDRSASARALLRSPTRCSGSRSSSSSASCSSSPGPRGALRPDGGRRTGAAVTRRRGSGRAAAVTGDRRIPPRARLLVLASRAPYERLLASAAEAAPPRDGAPAVTRLARGGRRDPRRPRRSAARLAAPRTSGRGSPLQPRCCSSRSSRSTRGRCGRRRVAAFLEGCVLLGLVARRGARLPGPLRLRDGTRRVECRRTTGAVAREFWAGGFHFTRSPDASRPRSRSGGFCG